VEVVGRVPEDCSIRKEVAPNVGRCVVRRRSVDGGTRGVEVGDLALLVDDREDAPPKARRLNRLALADDPDSVSDRVVPRPLALWVDDQIRAGGVIDIVTVGSVDPALACGREVEPALAEVLVDQESDDAVFDAEELPEPHPVDRIEIVAKEQMCGLDRRERDPLARGPAVSAGIVKALAGVAPDANDAITKGPVHGRTSRSGRDKGL